MKIPQDYHIHTAFSPDSSAAPEGLCRRALELGIPEIGFSEHWDVVPYEKDIRYLQPLPWYAEIERLRGLFAGQLTLRAGIEIGEAHLYPTDAAWVLSQAPFDYVLGSLHYVGEHLMFSEAYFCQHSADEVYSAYFAELEKMVRVADIDIVAHFDVPARVAKPIIGYDPTRYEDAIRAVLKIVIQRGLALDVNVAGLRKPSRVISPDPLILGWYAQMGGERVTLGSDAHALDHLGLNLDKAIQAIQDAGLTQVTQYEKRQARLMPIK
jgi:histidinol-phosphatase (PHP family)